MTGETIVQQSRALPRPSFVAQHGYPFLVFGELDGRTEEPGAFHTNTFRAVTRRPGETPPLPGATDASRSATLAMPAPASTAASPPVGIAAPRRMDMSATAALPTLSSFLASQSRFGGVIPVLKSERNPYAGRISIGRAATNDVVIPTLHVSKLHAHFIQSDGNRWGLRDAQSTNATFVNSRRCPPGELVALHLGDTLLFGSLEARFLDASALFDLVNRR